MGEGDDPEPLVACDLQGGTLEVYETEVRIDRSSASMFDDRTIRMTELTGVNYAPGLLTGHIQLVSVDVEPADAGFLSHPVDENTLYFPRTARDCTRRARDAILERCQPSGAADS